MTVTVSDGSLSATDDVSFTVRKAPPTPNRRPTVTIYTSDQDVDGGASVSLDATASDPDGDALNYLWSGSGSFADESALDTIWTAPAAQSSDRTYQLTITVSDGSQSASDSVSFTVRKVTPPSLPTITIAPHSTALQGVTEGSDVVFQLSPDPAPKTDLTVYLRVTDPGAFLDGTAPTQMTISKGHTTAYLTLKTLNDQVDEAHGNISAELQSNTDYIVGSASSASVTIKDDDKPPAPNELRANGHLVNDKVTLTWNRVPRATDYNVQYVREVCTPGVGCARSADPGWQTPPDVSISGIVFKKAIFGGLDEKTLYRVQARGVNDENENSDWSESAFVFPTREPLTAATNVALVKIQNFQADNQRAGSYRHTICLDDPAQVSNPANPNISAGSWTVGRVIVEIKDAIRTWQTAVGYSAIMSTTADPETSPGNCENPDMSSTHNQVVFVSDSDMDMYCANNLIGCWKKIGGDLSRGIAYPNQSIVLRASGAGRSWDTLTKGCSQLRTVVAHEAGHAFGFGHPDIPRSLGSMYLMDSETYEVCEPQAYDVVAAMANYQSR